MTGIRRLPGVIYRDDLFAKQCFADGSWRDLTMGDALRKTAARVPDRIAFASETDSITFREFDELTDRLAASLIESGVAPGERAIFQMGTVLDTAIALLACLKAGIVPVCTIPQYREIEIGQLTVLSGASAYFVQADFSQFDLVGFAQSMQSRYPQLAHLVVARGEARGALSQRELIEKMPLDRARAVLGTVHISSQDCFAFQLSGGSTGVPKVIPRFHGEYLAHGPAWSHQQKMDEHSVAVWSLPILHNAGMVYAIIPCILDGRTTVLLSRPDISLLLESIQRFRATHAASIGPIAAQLLNTRNIGDYDLSSLRFFITMNRADAVEAHLGVKAANLYGITEGLVMISSPDDPPEARHGTNGRPCLPTDDVRVLNLSDGSWCGHGELGELVFRGSSSLTGYFNAPDLTAETLSQDGYVRTGDLVRSHQIDGKTYFSFEGRLKDNINRGGEKYGTEEVETLVRSHPAVADVAVVAMPDPVLFERACAWIIPRPGHLVPDVPSLGQHLIAKGLAKFKLPERIETIESFPVTRVGKLDKAKLREMVRNKLADEAVALTTRT